MDEKQAREIGHQVGQVMSESDCREKFFDYYWIGHTLKEQSPNRLVNELAWLKTEGLSLEDSLKQAHKEFGEVHILISLRDNSLIGPQARKVINGIWDQLNDHGAAPEKTYFDAYHETAQLSTEFIDKAFGAYKGCACGNETLQTK